MLQLLSKRIYKDYGHSVMNGVECTFKTSATCESQNRARISRHCGHLKTFKFVLQFETVFFLQPKGYFFH